MFQPIQPSRENISDLLINQIKDVSGEKNAALEITGTIQGRSVKLFISSEHLTSAKLREIIQKNGIQISNQSATSAADYKGSIEGNLVFLKLSSDEQPLLDFHGKELRLVQTAHSADIVSKKSLPGRALKFMNELISGLKPQNAPSTQAASSSALNPTRSEAQHIESSATVQNATRANIIARLDGELGVVSSVVRSREGAGGVFFLETKGSDDLLLKLAGDPSSHVIADRLFRMFQFTTPNYTPVDKESSTGKKAFKILKDLGSKYLTSKNLKEEKLIFDKQIENGRLMVLEKIQGISFRQLSVDDKLAALKNPQVLRAIGEMLFLDTVIGNVDRLDWGHCNLGNLMLQNEGQADRRNRPIAVIDHEFDVSPENLDSIRSRLEQLFNKDGQRLNKIINKFIRTLGVTFQGDQAFPEIKKGLEAAKQEFLENFANKEAVNNLLNVSGSNRFNPEVFMNIIAFVRNLSA